jgi:hypothetical protein
VVAWLVVMVPVQGQVLLDVLQVESAEALGATKK